jgi:DNA-binding CsgD family transcriptional regulator
MTAQTAGAAGADAKAPQEDAAASIESSLAEALALVENALARHRDGGGRSVLDLAGDEEVVALTTRRLLAGARQEVVCVSTPLGATGGPAGPLIESLRAVSSMAVDVQILFHAPAGAAHRQLRALVAPTDTLEMRVTCTPLPDLVLVDRQVALVVAQGAPGARQAQLLRNPVLVQALRGLFADGWAAAAPVTRDAPEGDRTMSETSIRILASLRAGEKDDTAARKLGMSVRTYRRHVADIMRGLDAASRFQAGVRAAELRLLPATGAPRCQVEG